MNAPRVEQACPGADDSLRLCAGHVDCSVGRRTDRGGA